MSLTLSQLSMHLEFSSVESKLLLRSLPSFLFSWLTAPCRLWWGLTMLTESYLVLTGSPIILTWMPRSTGPPWPGPWPLFVSLSPLLCTLLLSDAPPCYWIRLLFPVPTSLLSLVSQPVMLSSDSAFERFSSVGGWIVVPQKICPHSNTRNLWLVPYMAKDTIKFKTLRSLPCTALFTWVLHTISAVLIKGAKR